MKTVYTFFSYLLFRFFIQKTICLELNIGKIADYSSGSSQVTVKKTTELQNLYTHKFSNPVLLKDIYNGKERLYFDQLLVSDQLLLSASVVWSFETPSIIQLNLEQSSVLLINEKESLDVQAIFSKKLVTNIKPRIHSDIDAIVDINLSNIADYNSNNSKVYVTNLKFSEDRFKRYTVRNYNLESTRLGKILYNNTELKTKFENNPEKSTESNLDIPYKNNVYSIQVYAYNNFPLLIEFLYTFDKRQFYGYTPEEKWHHVYFPAFHDPSFLDFLYDKLNYYACKNGFKYTINVALATNESDHSYNIDNYCVVSDTVETTQNRLRTSFFQNEKFKTAGYVCVEHTASNGKMFFVDHLMAKTSVLKFPNTPSFTKSIRVYNRMNTRQYLIGFVNELDKVIYYKYENGSWSEEKTLSKDKNEKLSDEIKLLLDKLSANDITTFTINDVSDPNKETPENFDLHTIDASDTLHKITTFIIEKETDYNSNVTVTPKSNHPANGFIKYTHEPKTKPCQKSLVLFKGKKLFKRDSSQSKLLVIDEVQDKQLNNIDVYFSNTIEFPLLTGFFQSNNTTEYYFSKLNGDRVFWQLLDQSALKEFINETITNNDIHTKLIENRNQRLIKLLNKIALSLVNTVYVLVDKREDYNRTVVSDAYKTALGTKRASFTIGTFQPEIINVTSVDVPSLKLSNFKCFVHTIIPNGTGPYQTKLLIPLQHMSIVSNKSVYSYMYVEIELYKNDFINDSNRENLTFKKGEIKLYVYYYGEDPRPLLMCYENKVYTSKRLGDPERTKQVNIKYNKWSRLTDIDGCDHNVGVTNSGSNANDQKILEALIDVVQYFNPVTLNSEKLPKEPTKDFTEGKADMAKYLIHDLTSNYKVSMKLTSSKMETYRIHTYEHNGLDGQNNAAGFTLGDVIFKGAHGGYDAYKVNYATATQDPAKKMRHLVKVSAYFHMFDSDFQDPLLVILEFKDGTAGTANTIEYYKLTVRSNDVPGTMQWDKDDTVATIMGDKIRLLEFLNDVRYNLKYSAKMQLHFTRPSYPFLALNHEGTENYPSLTGTETSITVSKESCSELEKKGFKCYRQAISSVKTSHLYYITALKMSLPVRNNKDAIIQLFDETGQKAIDKLFYDYAYGDVYVYYYRNYNHPLLFCFNGSAFMPYDDNSDFPKWVKVNKIQKCDYTTLSTEEINQLLTVLTISAHFIGLDQENDNQRAQNILDLTIDDECINYMPDTLRISVLDKSDFILDSFKRDRATKNLKKLTLYEFDDIWPGYYYNITSWNYGKFGEYVGYAQTLISCAISNVKHYGYYLCKFSEGIYSHRVEWYKREGNTYDIVILVYTNSLFVYKFRIPHTSRQWKNDEYSHVIPQSGYLFIGVEPVVPNNRQELYSIYCERLKFINKLDFDSGVPTRPRTSKEALDYLQA